MISEPINLAIVCLDSQYIENAKSLADHFQIPICDACPETSSAYFLVEKHIQFVTTVDKQVLRIGIDFLSDKMKWWQSSVGKKHPLAKAIGIKPKQALPTVIDATAGMGKDAFLMASLGCSVLMLEANPIIATLLRDAINHLDQQPLSGLLLFQETDSVSFLQTLPQDKQPDVIYLDPMFPESKKHAKVKKEMQVLQKLHTQTSSSVDLLNIALNTAQKRVVVKRPKTAETLTKQQPNFNISSKSIRYDVYLTTQNR